jgi:hypothetical protein
VNKSLNSATDSTVDERSGKEINDLAFVLNDKLICTIFHVEDLGLESYDKYVSSLD